MPTFVYTIICCNIIIVYFPLFVNMFLSIKKKICEICVNYIEIA